MMQWTDRIRRIKFILVTGAAIIALVSLFISHFLTRDLYIEERNKMEVWAEAMRSLNSADENTDLGLVLKVINGNNTIPVAVVDAAGNVQTYRNLDINASDAADSLRVIAEMAAEMKRNGRAIAIDIGGRPADKIYVCYDDSLLLRRLAYYPYVQLGVVMIFVVVAIFALLTSKKAEQNKVWVGLSKETAHQLGTPISSLMAWKEILIENYPDDPLIPEIGKDIDRLQLIADRFSKIGSMPELSPCGLNDIIGHVAEYMGRRTSSRVKVRMELPREDLVVMINAQLFEWVIENLCKNAVDAMGSNGGTITITVSASGNKAVIDVADTGKGIPKNDLSNVFRPGFTTKKRGWGLGLSLAKRIIDEYHHGHIRVLHSEVGVGTTFRIEIRLA